MAASSNSSLRAWTITKKDGKECLVVAKSLDAAIEALPSGSEVTSARLVESYANTSMKYGSMTSGTPMPVYVAGDSTSY